MRRLGVRLTLVPLWTLAHKVGVESHSLEDTPTSTSYSVLSALVDAPDLMRGRWFLLHVVWCTMRLRNVGGLYHTTLASETGVSYFVKCLVNVFPTRSLLLVQVFGCPCLEEQLTPRNEAAF